jgi:tetratricopeptide (TPR) repeat protein
MPPARRVPVAAPLTRWWRGAIFCVLVLVAPAVARAQVGGVSRVLVMPLVASADSQAPAGAGASLWLGEGAAILLTERLSALGVPTFTREDRLAAFERLQLPMSPALTRATLIRVSELIGAAHVVFGEIRLGTTVHVRVRTITLSSGRELPAVVDEAPLTDLVTLVSRVGDRLTTLVPRSRPVQATIPPLPIDAFERYVKGLVAASPTAQQRFLEEASRMAPGDPRILMALWSVYTAAGDHDRALAVANAVPPDSVLARKGRFAVARSLVDLKRYDGAFQELSALDASRRTAAVSNMIGLVQIDRGILTGPNAATVYLNRAVNDEPDNTDYLFNLGYAYALAQRPTEALSWLREAVRFDAADGDAHLVMSAVLAGSGRQTEAQREFELARLLGTAVDSATLSLGAKVPANMARPSDDLDLAPTLRVSTLTAAPGQTDQQETAAFHLGRARELLAQQKDREATEELRRSVYLAPYEDQPHLLLGGIYRRTGQLEKAIDEFKVALWCRETAAAHLALGNALLDSGDRAGARREADRTLVLAPASPEARDLLRRVNAP